MSVSAAQPEVGQIWDDMFGDFTYEVIHVTEQNALVRARNYTPTNLTTEERLIPIKVFTTSGNGWVMLSPAPPEARQAKADQAVGVFMRSYANDYDRMNNPFVAGCFEVNRRAMKDRT